MVRIVKCRWFQSLTVACRNSWWRWQGGGRRGKGRGKKKIKAWKVSLMRLSFSFIKDHVALPSWPGLKIRKYLNLVPALAQESRWGSPCTKVCVSLIYLFSNHALCLEAWVLWQLIKEHRSPVHVGRHPIESTTFFFVILPSKSLVEFLSKLPPWNPRAGKPLESL